MYEDPVVAEIHRIREELSARFNHDLKAIVEHLKEREAEHEKNGGVVIRKPLPKSPEPLPASAVGAE